MIYHDIDISGRLEHKTHTSYLAIGGLLFNFCVAISPAEKEKLWALTAQYELERSQAKKRRKKPASEESQRIRVYMIMCFFLLRNCPAGVDAVVIDRDYPPKKMRAERGRLKTNLRIVGADTISLSIGAVPKGYAHRIAGRASKEGADLNLTAKMIMTFYR